MNKNNKMQILKNGYADQREKHLWTNNIHKIFFSADALQIVTLPHL